jgi:hypothetical protein
MPGNYVQFDTSGGAEHDGGRGQAVHLPLPSSGDGFQVLVLDKALEPMLGTPTAFANGAPVGDTGMAKLLG